VGEPETVIRVENLSKRYVISHAAERGRYSTLRDTIAQGAKSLARRVIGRDKRVTDSSREEFWALKDVSFEVKRGEAIGIIGRNGAGKSTLLKILSRITEPTIGRIAIDGRVASLLEVGTGFHPELTGRENVYLNGSILGMTRAEVKRKFDEIVAFAEIEKFLDTPVKRYSSGMYVRLAFAVAAHLEPEILIVDEVLAVGDAAFQAKCLGKMGEVAKGGLTVLFVSHNVQAINRLTSRCVYLQSGHKIGDGLTSEVTALYAKNMAPRQAGGLYTADTSRGGRNRLFSAQVRTSESDDIHWWGKPISFEFVIEVVAPSPSICFSFQIVNNLGTAVCHFSSFNPAAGWGQKPGHYRLSCEIPKFRLFMGNFTLTTWLADRRINDLTESLTDLCAFKVDMGEHHREQYDWQPNDCAYLEDCAWQLMDSQFDDPSV
jgi:lipopolysaccharide transport system ATP-binding protein